MAFYSTKYCSRVGQMDQIELCRAVLDISNITRRRLIL